MDSGLKCEISDCSEMMTADEMVPGYPFLGSEGSAR